MMIEERILMIISEVVLRKKRNIDSLLSAHHLSERQLMYCIDRINDEYLYKTEYEIEIKGNQLFLSEACEQFIVEEFLGREITVLFSKQNRIRLLFVYLCSEKEYISLDSIAYYFKYSRSSVMNDIKELKDYISEFGIEITYSREEGYKLLGDEREIRFLCLKFLLEFIHEDNYRFCFDLLNHEFVDKISYVSQVINNFSKASGYLMPTNRRVEIELGLSILFNRFEKYQINCDGCDEIKINRNSLVTELTLKLYQLFDSPLESNLEYLYGWLQSMFFENTDQNLPIINYVNEFLSKFELLSGIKFVCRERAFKSLYQHLAQMYYRVMYKFPIINPLSIRVEDSYPEMFSLIKRTMEFMDDEILDINNEEIAFLTIQILAILSSNENIRDTHHKVGLMCVNGVGISLLLKNQLEDLFPSIEFINIDSLQMISNLQLEAVISTNVNQKLLQLKIPYFIVSPILSREEKQRLKVSFSNLFNDEDKKILSVAQVVEKIKSEVSREQLERIEFLLLEDISEKNERKEENQPVLSDIIFPELVQLKIKASNWEEAIRIVGGKFVEYGFATEAYVDDMVNITLETGPYIVITKHVAMPHARPEAGAKKLAISIGVLDNSVEFGNKENDPVKYVFGLCALDNHTHLTAMSELAELLDDSEFYRFLDNASNPCEVVSYIKEYEGRKDEYV